MISSLCSLCTYLQAKERDTSYLCLATETNLRIINIRLWRQYLHNQCRDNLKSHTADIITLVHCRKNIIALSACRKSSMAQKYGHYNH